MMKKARGEGDPGQKRLILAKVGAAKTLDDNHKKQLAMDLAALDQPPATPSQLPSASRDPAVPPSAVTPPPPTTRVVPPPHPTQTTAPTVAPTTSATTAPTSTTVKPTGQSVVEKARLAGLDGRDQEVKNLLEGRVRTGKAGPEEVRLLKEACKKLHDSACVEDIKRQYP